MLRLYREVCLFSSAALLFTISQSVNATQTIAENQIPADYVHVPGSLAAHKSCVHEVPNGSHIDKNKDVYLNGSLLGHVPNCQHPVYAVNTNTKASAIPNVENSNHPFSWFEWDPTSSNNNFGATWVSYLQSFWTVPTAGGNNADWFALWNGLQNGTYNSDSSATGSTTLIQPVLAWNVTYPAETGRSQQYYAGYSITAWHVWVTDPSTANADGFLYSSPISVSSGDTIFGMLEATTCNSSGVCTWFAVTQDYRTNQYTYFSVDLSVSMTRALGAVLEFPAVTSCSDFPNGTNGSTSFASTEIDVGTSSQEYNAVSNASWTHHLSPNPPWGSSTTYPSCGNNYSWSSTLGTDSTLTLNY